jgi:hypothetical protein
MIFYNYFNKFKKYEHFSNGLDRYKKRENGLLFLIPLIYAFLESVANESFISFYKLK